MSQELLKIGRGPSQCCILCWERQTSSSEAELKPAKHQIADLLGVELELYQIAQICNTCTSKIISFHEYRESVRKNFSLTDVKVKVETLEVPVEPEMMTIESLNWREPEFRDFKTELSHQMSQQEHYEIQPKSKHRRNRRRDDMMVSERNLSEEDLKIKSFFNLRCKYCDVSPIFDTFILLRNHIKQSHHIDRPFIECCNIKLFKRCQIMTHLTFHTNPSLFKCSICGHQCKDKDGLKEHVSRRHSDPNNKKFQCDKCDRSFSCRQSIRKHVTTVHLSDEDRAALKAENTCTQCGLGFLTNSILAHHIRQRHENAYACVCDICAKSFKTKQNFISHYKTNHTDQVPEPKQCPVCHKWLGIKESLRNHIGNVHKNPGPHFCSICGKEAPTIRALKHHIDYMHNDERKYPCSVCEKTFKRPIALKEHMTTHFGGALYSCPFCDKSFNSSSNMYSHKKKAHPMLYEAAKAAKNGTVMAMLKNMEQD